MNTTSVWTPAFPLIVRVHLRKERAEGIPVDQRGDLTQCVPECREFGIFVPDCKIEEGTHLSGIDPAIHTTFGRGSQGPEGGSKRVFRNTLGQNPVYEISNDKSIKLIVREGDIRFGESHEIPTHRIMMTQNSYSPFGPRTDHLPQKVFARRGGFVGACNLVFYCICGMKTCADLLGSYPKTYSQKVSFSP